MNERNVHAVSERQSVFWRTVPRWLTVLALGFQAAVVAVLLVLSICFTVIFERSAPEPGNVTERVHYHLGLPSIPFVLGIVALFAALALLAVGIARLPRRWVLVALLVYVTVVQIIWITSLGLTTYGYPDSRSLMDAADTLLKGNLNQFSPDFCPHGSTEAACVNRGIPSAYTYFSYYPFQSGPMLWYLLVFALFGAKNVFAFQIVSALAVTALVAVLWRFGTHLGLDAVGHGAFTVLVATCVPLLMFAAFVYPNAVGFFITIAGAAVVAEAFHMKKVWTSGLTIVAGFLICGIGIVFKSTYQIVILAAILAVIFAVWRNRRFWQLIVAFVSAGGAFVISKLPVSLVQHWTGQDFGKGMPMISWIALGLGEPDNVPAGWWSRFALDAFEKTGNDYASLYSELGDSSNHFSGLASFLLVGRGSNILLRYENVAQTVMYLLAFIGLIALTRAVFRNRNEEGNADKVFVQVLLCASFLGGFLCYVLWEAKGIYTLPFYLLLVPMAAYGIQTAVAWGKSVHQRRRLAARPVAVQ